METKRLKEKGNKWCEIEISLENGRLSICGSYGEILTTPKAKRQALEYWASYFEECPEEMKSMNEAQGTNFRSPKSAAKYVIDTDGQYHGLDVHKESGNKVYIVSGCGQCVKELEAWFPEYAHLLPYHLNDMHAGTPEQEAAIAKFISLNPNRALDYTDFCNQLTALNLLTVEHEGKPYTYGSAWLKRELPSEIRNEVEALFRQDEARKQAQTMLNNSPL